MRETQNIFYSTLTFEYFRALFINEDTNIMLNFNIAKYYQYYFSISIIYAFASLLHILIFINYDSVSITSV